MTNVKRIIPLTISFLLISCFIYSQLYYVNMEKDSKWEQDLSGITKIKVYWENPSPENYTQRQWVQQAVKETWSKVANIEFTGWEQYDFSGIGIRIYIDDYAWPHTDGLGTAIDGKFKGMVLNFNFLGTYKCNSSRTREYCIKAIAAHEFGHALGIAHEQDRSDCGCPEVKAGEGGMVVNGYYVTPCDLHSIMNYCNPVWSNGGKLSDYDIKGIQAVYGIRKTTFDYSNQVKFSSAIDKLGDNQVWENLNLTLGDQQFIYNINANNPEEIKSFSFKNSGFYNYNISSFSYHKDGKFHKGAGSGSIYIDKTKSYKFEILAKNPEQENFEITISAKDILSESGSLYKYSGNNDAKWIPPSTINFLRNGQKPIFLMLLDNVKTEKFYIYSDGTIMVYNSLTQAYFDCGKKQVPFYKDGNGWAWSWSFYRTLKNNMQETYSITTAGEVWSLNTSGTMTKFGIVTYVDF